MDSSPAVPKPKAFPASSPRTSAPSPSSKDPLEKDFMHWCQQAMGISSLLEIAEFDYYDYMQAMPTEDWVDDDMVDGSAVEDLPLLSVRGLAASRDIEEGEVVIRIPTQALVSVSTLVDQDPILSRVMGPEARASFGWVLADEEDPFIFEIPLLAVALLHHKRLGSSSPIYQYINILDKVPTGSMPFLWSTAEMKKLSEGVRAAARGLREEIHSMYSTVVEILIVQRPDLFGPPEDGDWMFSLEKFQWAFALINSRHWHLPAKDLEPQALRKEEEKPDVAEEVGLPPASTPTEAWVSEQQERLGLDEEDTPSRTVSHSFLAPVADLLNFGPPCTRGRFDESSHSFEIVATCSFRKGQEVTFWYSDECDHVVAAVYGFNHPLVPPCPTAEEYRQRAEDWKRQSEVLEEELKHSYDELDHLEKELQAVLDVLADCDCCESPIERLGEGRGYDHDDGPAEEHHHRIRSTRRRRSREEF